jgi:hypothetical protein
LREATPKALDGFELELLRNNCPRAALLCRARASELRAQESQKAQALALSEAQRKMIADQVQAGVKAELEKMRVKMSEAQAKKQPAKATNEMPQAPASPSLPVLQNGAPPLAPDLATAVLQASASMSGVKVPGA